MTLKQLLDRASSGYPDGLEERYDQNGKFVHHQFTGDGLADFVVRELISTFEAARTDEEQIAEARRVISVAIRELQGVHAVLYLNANEARGKHEA